MNININRREAIRGGGVAALTGIGIIAGPPPASAKEPEGKHTVTVSLAVKQIASFQKHDDNVKITMSNGDVWIVQETEQELKYRIANADGYNAYCFLEVEAVRVHQ